MPRRCGCAKRLPRTDSGSPAAAGWHQNRISWSIAPTRPPESRRGSEVVEQTREGPVRDITSERISSEMSMTQRKAEVEYVTKETSTKLVLDLDGSGTSRIETGIGFLNHMLEQLSFHGLMDLEVACTGDLHVDNHHTVEDVALAFGKALNQILGERKGIRRFSHCVYPMDETLVRVALDLSGRPEFHFQGEFVLPRIGELDTQMIPHFFKSVSVAGQLTLHMAVLYGENDHHKAEGLFKAFARALSDAVTIDPRRTGVASTKGSLGTS